MFIKGLDLANDDKLNIVYDGDGNNYAGVGRDAEEALVISEYDKRGGLIKKDGRKVKTGCFYDFRSKKPFAKPVIEFADGPTARPGTMVEKIDGPGKAKGGRTAAKKPASRRK